MTRSVRLSQLVLRIFLAAVFLYLGVDRFIHPFGAQLAYLVGVFEILAGLSFITGVFMRPFALLGAVVLAVLAVSSGRMELIVRDAGLIGGLLALTLWPERM